MDILWSSYLSSIIKKNIRLKSYLKLSHLTHIKKKNCPCSKGEYCTNGLKCTDQNCFLFKGSTFVTKSTDIPNESLNALRLILASDYRQGYSFHSFKY